MATARDIADRALQLVRLGRDELVALAEQPSDDRQTDALEKAVRLLPIPRANDRSALREEEPAALALLLAARAARPGGAIQDIVRRDSATAGWDALAAGDLSAAADVAASLLQKAAETSDEHWNDGNLLHQGHIMLGMVRLLEGDVAAAEAELRAAGQTPGSPQLNSFGPDLSLAWALLRLEREEAYWTTSRASLGSGLLSDAGTTSTKTGDRPQIVTAFASGHRVSKPLAASACEPSTHARRARSVARAQRATPSP